MLRRGSDMRGSGDSIARRGIGGAKPTSLCRCSHTLCEPRIPYAFLPARANDLRQPKMGRRFARGTCSFAAGRCFAAVTGGPDQARMAGEAELAMAKISQASPPEALTFDDVLLKPGLSE